MALNLKSSCLSLPSAGLQVYDTTPDCGQSVFPFSVSQPFLSVPFPGVDSPTLQAYPQCSFRSLRSFLSYPFWRGALFVVCISISVLMSPWAAGCGPSSFLYSSFLSINPLFFWNTICSPMKDLWGAESGTHWLLLYFGNRMRMPQVGEATQYIVIPRSSYEVGL